MTELYYDSFNRADGPVGGGWSEGFTNSGGGTPQHSISILSNELLLHSYSQGGFGGSMVQWAYPPGTFGAAYYETKVWYTSIKDGGFDPDFNPPSALGLFVLGSGGIDGINDLGVHGFFFNAQVARFQKQINGTVSDLDFHARPNSAALAVTMGFYVTATRLEWYLDGSLYHAEDGSYDTTAGVCRLDCVNNGVDVTNDAHFDYLWIADVVSHPPPPPPIGRLYVVGM